MGNTYSLFKLTSIGQHIWSVTYSPNSAHDFGTSVGHDPAGTIYITGGVFNFDNGTYDFTTLNYHPNATNDWIARYNHIANLRDVALTTWLLTIVKTNLLQVSRKLPRAN
jgi:hypothetical protein